MSDVHTWWGNQKIGVLGYAQSGKTILLTSLLWHLERHDPQRFKLGEKGNARIEDFKYKVDKNRDFGFERNRNRFICDLAWPRKTKDYGVAKCQYHNSEKRCDRHLTFVDIPGERVSDILIWRAKSYAEWVDLLCAFWSDYKQTWQIMAQYWKAVEEKKSLDVLVREYKNAMLNMGKAYYPITPSTYFLGEDGSQIGDENNCTEQQLLSRPIWRGGDIIPVSPEWKQSYPKKYKELEKNFNSYKKKVLSPLYKEIESCDHFVFCVDIFNILEAGTSCGIQLLQQQQREFREFVKHLAPSKFRRFMNRMILKRARPRLAFVATKADMVIGKNLEHLRYLLQDFASPVRSFSGIDVGYFTCSACVSTEIQESAVICDEFYQGSYKQLNIKADLPDRFPDRDNWPQNCFPKNMKPLIPPSQPPRQMNLDILLEFLVEDKETL